MKVAVVSPKPTDGTSWYRSNGPMSRLSKTDDDFQYVEFGGSELDWDVLLKFDILFLQRPFLRKHLKMMQKAVYLGLNVVIDWDDNLWRVPVSNPTHEMYSSEEVQLSLGAILATINPGYCLITVSTQALKDYLLMARDDLWIEVIPNAIDDELMCPFHFGNGAQKIGWRGSDTHMEDLLQYQGDLEKFMQTDDDIEWDFIGMNPYFLKFPYKNHRPGGIIEYYMLLKNRAWKAWPVMLKDNLFNRCKSNIMALEAAFAGAIPIVPSWPEWEHFGEFGAVVYDPDKYLSLYAALIEVEDMNETVRRKRFTKLSKYIYRNFTLEVVNKKRLKAYNLLLSK